MPNFSQTSLDILSHAHIDLQLIMKEVIKHFDFTVLESTRSKEEQNKDYVDGNSQLQWPHSTHNSNPSIGLDIAPYPVNWAETSRNLGRFYYLAGIVKMCAEKLYQEGKITHGVRWGGDFNQNDNFMDDGFVDLPHFELTNR